MPFRSGSVTPAAVPPVTDGEVRLPRAVLAIQLVRLVASLADALEDDVVVRAYREVAVDRLEPAAALLGAAVLRARPPLAEAELDVLDECLDELGVRDASFDELEPTDRPRDFAFSFDPGPGGRAAAAVDEAVLPSLQGVDGVLGAWCAWRYPHGEPAWPPPRPWVVVEVADPAVVLDLLGRLHGPGTRVPGPTAPVVEVYPTGHAPSETQRHVQYLGELIHLGVPVPQFAFSDLFAAPPVPGAAAPTGLVHLPDDEARSLLARLRAGRVVVALPDPGTDLVDPGRGRVVPLSLRTDGRWLWSEATHYYLEHHRIAPPPALYAHLRAGTGPPRPPTDVAAYLAVMWLQRTLRSAREPGVGTG